MSGNPCNTEIPVEEDECSSYCIGKRAAYFFRISFNDNIGVLDMPVQKKVSDGSSDDKGIIDQLSGDCKIAKKIQQC